MLNITALRLTPAQPAIISVMAALALVIPCALPVPPPSTSSSTPIHASQPVRTMLLISTSMAPLAKSATLPVKAVEEDNLTTAPYAQQDTKK